MENFLTWDILLSYGGCVAGTILVTEWLKKVFTKIPTQIVSFVVALVILVVGHLALGTFAWADSFLYLINAIGVALASNGGFDILKRAFGKKPEMEELVVDETDPEKGVYLNVSKSPTDFQDGETIQFKVKKISQE